MMTKYSLPSNIMKSAPSCCQGHSDGGVGFNVQHVRACSSLCASIKAILSFGNCVLSILLQAPFALPEG